MIQAIIVNGTAEVGKDTFVDLCIDAFEARGFEASKKSSVDQVKKAATLLGWDELKDDKGRRFLSDLKDLSTVNYDGPLNYMLQCMEWQGVGVIFFMIREPEEITKFVETVPGTRTMKVVRDSVEIKYNNHADQRVNEYEYDYVITNNGTLDDLKQLAEGFADVIGATLQ